MFKKLMFLLLIAIIIINPACIAVFAESTANTAQNGAGNVGTKTGNSSTQNNSIEKVTALVRSKIDVPQEYEEFSGEMGSDGSKTVYRLRWTVSSSSVSRIGGSMDITTDIFGNILSYNHYRYNRDYEYKRKLPGIAKERAVDSAWKFAYYICPDIMDQVSYDSGKDNISIEFDGSYRIYFCRRYKNIPFYDNGISVLVNGDSGEIRSFTRNWNDELVFPDPGKAMTIVAAQLAYKEKIGLVLRYKRTYGKDPDTTYLEYSPAGYDQNYCINAFTGEKMVEIRNYNPYFNMNYRDEMYMTEMNRAVQETGLTEKELTGAKKTEGLMIVEKAEKLARSITEFGMDAKCRLNGYNYGKYTGAGSVVYILKMNFVRSSSKDDFGGEIPEEKIKVMIASGEYGRTFNFVFNAKTSEIISFNSYGNSGESSSTTTYDRTTMRKAVESFLARYKKQKLAQAELLDNEGNANNYPVKYGMGSPGGINNFTYIRKVNGIQYEDNGMRVDFDTVSGRIGNYSENWDELNFVPVKDVISPDGAYEVLFNEVGYGLRYAMVQKSDEKPGAKPGENSVEPSKSGTSEGVIGLVYSTDTGKPACIDAGKGIVINYYNAEPYWEAGTCRYKDIDGSFAKKSITALAEAGILPAGDGFRPDDVIVQKEFLLMIGKMKGIYNVNSADDVTGQKAIDGMYRIIMNDGIIDEDERNPDQEVTREEAVKYLLKSAGYKKFAELDGIFNCSFTDREDIDPGLVGYVTIAKALGIIDGKDGYFLPKEGLTRAEAAEMAYNYMRK